MLGNLENSAVATELEEVSFHFNPKERQCHVISHASKFSCSVVSGFKVVLKIVQARFQRYWSVCELRTSGCSSWI